MALNWVTVSTTTLPSPARVDANYSGDITASDALAILKAAVGGDQCDGQVCACDVAGGGTVTASDALAALEIAVGQPIPLACTC